MPSGGVILLDNMLMSGNVLNPQDEAVRIMDELNRKIASDDRVENVLLTIRDGVQLVRKK
jgi:caffeoyl-CoA O-methyltransferase